MSNSANHPSADEIYKRLTGVSIGEQLDEWDARGKGYYGEFLLFTEIYKYIPGCFKILMNLQIPSESGRTTEIDLLLIHETGLYVFEAKYYKGAIYGKTTEAQWTQFFRTAPNKTFPSPVFQNQWHIEQLQKLAPDTPIHSFIVFANDECQLNVTGSMPNTTICKRNDLCQYFGLISRQSTFALNTKKIDDIFNLLKVYSPISETLFDYEDKKDINFYQFIEMMNAYHSERKTEMENEHAVKESELNKKYVAKETECVAKMKTNNRRTVAICSAIIVLLLIIVSNTISANQQKLEDAIASADVKVGEYKSLMNQYKNDTADSKAELEEFKKKWEIITDFEIEGEKLKDDYVLVDYANITNSADFDDVVNLAFSITHNGEDFYVLIDKSSMFNIVLKDGRVIETPYYDSPYYSYSLGYSQTSKNLTVKKVEFSGFSAEDIAFIKLTNLQIKRIAYKYGEKPILTDYEILLYKANQQIAALLC